MNWVANMKWQWVLVATMVWSVLLVGVVQEADIAVAEVVERQEIEQNTFVVTVTPEGADIFLPSYRGVDKPAYFYIPEGFFAKETKIAFHITDDVTDVPQGVDKPMESSADDITRAITPVITMSFPFGNLSLDNSYLSLFYIKPFQGVDFDNMNPMLEGDHYFARFHVNTPNKYHDILLMEYEDNYGFMNTVTLYDMYREQGFPNVEVKMSFQAFRLTYSQLPDEDIVSGYEVEDTMERQSKND